MIYQYNGMGGLTDWHRNSITLRIQFSPYFGQFASFSGVEFDRGGFHEVGV